MKNTFFLIAFSIMLITLGSCKKESEKPANGNANAGWYMRFKLDGIETEFKSLPIAQSAFNSGKNLYVSGFLAYKDSSKTNQDLVDIAIINKDPLSAGAVYKDPVKSFSDGQAVPQVILTYYNSKKESFTSVGIFSDEEGNFSSVLPDYQNLVADAKVTIIKVGTNFIKGTFSGTVFKLNSSNNTYDKIPLTEGEFNLHYLH
jgi:hypothetical protein